MGPVHGLDLLAAHRERLMMRAGERLPGAQFGQHRLHVLHPATHPLQFSVLKALLHQGRAHVVVSEDRAVFALCGLVQLDGVVLDGGGLELLVDALFHVARCLSYLEETLVRLVANRVGVDARARRRLGGEDLLDRLTHRPRP